MKFTSKPVAEHREVPVADQGRFEGIVAYWSERNAKRDVAHRVPAYVVSVAAPSDPDYVREARLAEILALVGAKGDAVVGYSTQVLTRTEPRTLLTKGVCERVGDEARAAGADLLILDAELTPSQTRNLEDATGLPVADREGVILEVFIRHAQTKRARIQVEIARLEYLRPRIRGLGLDMDQQTGGAGPLRGAGETASELLARQLDGRLAELRRSNERLERSEGTRRQGRGSSRRVVLVGYTNAGKTSLMNALTAAELSARDVPFETLDTTSRNLTRHGGDVLISDTVGFIRRLPERLMASFASTLAEVREASLLVVVVDAADPEREEQVATTEALLEELGAGETERLFVLNKADKLGRPLSSNEIRALTLGRPYVVLSSFDEGAVAELATRIVRAARGEGALTKLFVPYEAADVMSMVYAKARVVDARSVERGVRFTLGGDPEVIAAIERALRGRQA
ncbi:MAG: GTPase HflX [Deltaproteobacteria bacterium]|jgi:GTP-binding protein HflX